MSRRRLPGPIPHEFKRTAVRTRSRGGVSEKTAMQLAGHKTRCVFDRYDIVDESDLRAATARLSEFMGTLSGTVTQSATAQAVTPKTVSALNSV